MLSIHYYIDKPNDLKSVVMISVSFRGQRLKVSSKISIDNSKSNELSSKLWNPKRERFKSSYIGALEYNFKLDSLQAKINALFIKSLKMNPKEQAKFLKNKIKLLVDPQKDNLSDNIDSDNMSLTDHFEDMIDKRSAGMEMSSRDGMPFGIEVIKAYRTTLNHIRAFEIEKGLKLDFEDIDEDFYQDFINYLLEKNLVNNTIGKIIKNIKIFMRRSIKKELTDNIKFLDFKVWDEEVSSFALDLDELKSIKELDLSCDEKLDKARDIFLIESFTCLRYKDLSSLSSVNIDMKRMSISIVTHKTRKQVTIPIFPFIKPILEKYNLNIPKISIHKYNLCIKLIAEKAGINDLFEVIRSHGKERRTIHYPKYKLITSTVARRSYITNCLRQEIPAQMIMKTTGHVKLENFLRYERMVKSEGAERVRDGFKDVSF